jgi:hypothetical protein
MEHHVELYVGKTQTVKVVLKITWCSFYLKVQQRRAHDVSQVRRRPIFLYGLRCRQPECRQKIEVSQTPPGRTNILNETAHTSNTGIARTYCSLEKMHKKFYYFHNIQMISNDTPANL